jgi:hypothetical protein
LQIIENQIKKLQSDYPFIFEDKTKYNTPIYLNNLIFYSWKKCKIINYSRLDVTMSVLLEDIIKHHNKQYQWHLVSAFEDYEKYLRNIYAYSICLQGKKELNEASLPTIYERAFELISENIKNKNASSILSEFRKILPVYKSLEIKNDRIYNMRFVLSFIQNIRNIIVHKEGITDDKELFLSRLLKENGIPEQGEDAKQCADYFNMYFPGTLNPNEITLLEIPVFDAGEINAKTDVLDNLFHAMLNSAYHICNELKEIYNGGVLNNL